MTESDTQSADTLLSPRPPSTPHRRLSNQSNSNLYLNDENEWSDVPDIETFKNEQRIIENTLNTLLNFKVPAKHPGRPPKIPKDIQKIPDTVREDFKSLSNINELHPGILLDYLTKVNSLNKKLLLGFEILSKKYTSLNDKISHSSTPADTPVSHLNPQQSDESVERKAERNTSNFNEDLFNKIDNLEQNSNANIIICSGETIHEITSRNDTSIKKDLLTTLKTFSPEIIESNVVSVNIFGKHRKQLKVTCSNQY